MPKYKYEANNGTIVNIRLSSGIRGLDTLADPSGAVVNPLLWADVSRSRRSQGLKPRQVLLTREETTPGGLKAIATVRVSCVTEAGAVALLAKASVTYKGSTWKPSTYIPEG